MKKHDNIDKSCEAILPGMSYGEAIGKYGMTVAYTSGVSMRPLIYSGVCYVGIVAAGVPAIGDILLFRQQRGDKEVNILHRVVAKDGDICYTRGDNCINCERVTPGQILGKAECVCWSKWVNRPGRHLPEPIDSVRRRLSLRYTILPLLFGAKKEDGGYTLHTDSAAHRRYVRLWTATWPLRRLIMQTRGAARATILKIMGR